MKTINKIKIYLLLSLMITTVGCDEFLDVNESPNNPTISNPFLTLPVAQDDFASLHGTTMNYLGNFIVYNYSVPSNWASGEALIKYNITTSFYETFFTTSYATILKNLDYIEKFEDGTGNYDAFKAIAKTMKSFQFQYLVDLYGDIPYSEALQRGANITPKYDDAATIYTSLIDQLTEAASLAVSLNGGVIYEDPADTDAFFGGDMTKWAQFANTIKLRLLIRLSGTGQDGYITSEVAKITANGAGYITTDVSANLGYFNDVGKQSPWYGYTGFNSEGVLTDRNDYTVATDYTLNYLQNTNDDRFSQIYSISAANTYKGAPQVTTLPGTGFTSNDLSHVGPGLLKSSAQDQPILLKAESMLLQAEAMVRGYMPGGMAGAQTMYENAIKASFAFLGVPPTVANSTAVPAVVGVTTEQKAIAYYGQSTNNVGWVASTDKIEAIITQKWIATNGVNALESWIELTRTGFPANLPIPVESDGARPVRLLYPSSEVERNSNNVPVQTQNAAFTSNPFWK